MTDLRLKTYDTLLYFEKDVKKVPSRQINAMLPYGGKLCFLDDKTIDESFLILTCLVDTNLFSYFRITDYFLGLSKISKHFKKKKLWRRGGREGRRGHY